MPFKSQPPHAPSKDGAPAPVSFSSRQPLAIGSDESRRRRILPLAFVAVLALLIVNAYVLIRSVDDVREHQQGLTVATDIKIHLESLMSHVKDVETGQRGFSVSGEDRFLEPFTQGRAAAPQDVERLRALVAGDAELMPLIDKLAVQADGMLDYHARAAETRRTDGMEAALALMRGGEGKQRMDEIRITAATIDDIMRKHLAEREAATAAASDRVDWAFLLSTALSLLLATAAYYFIRTNVRRQDEERHQLMEEAWVNAGVAELTESMRSDTSLQGMGDAALAFFSRQVGALAGSLYFIDRGELMLASSLGRTPTDTRPARIVTGQGLVGEALKQKRLLRIDRVPSGYLQISSSLGEGDPKEILVVPLVYEGMITGVMELASTTTFTDLQLRLVEEAQRGMAIAATAAIARKIQQDLLEETQRQAEELQAQQEELRASNAELEAQAESLRDTQQHLQVQQEELRQSNEELEQQTRALDAQKEALAAHNADLAETKRALELKAYELERASQYKSEFLSNMSHELRTPLNSLLLLATLIAENREGRLSEQQVEWANTIYKSGNDLLALISDILDLSKVEAGKIDLSPEVVAPADVVAALDRGFRHMAEHKGLKFTATVGAGVPKELRTDRLRLEQILKNLLSNAVKFTAKGEIDLTVTADGDGDVVVFAVKDSGIGISPDKLGVIFDAFQQADSSTSRSYGGTGLGLTISRELAKLLGGDVDVDSKVGEGSTFKLRIPREMPTPSDAPVRAKRRPSRVVTTSGAANGAVKPASAEAAREEARGAVDARDTLQGDVDGTSERRILIVEDDPVFGKALLDLAREAGFKAVLAPSGRAGLSYAEKNQVAAVLLDMQLPDISGLVVLEQLKRSAATRHLPVHVISGLDFSRNAFNFGALGYLKKPASKASLVDLFGKLDVTLKSRNRRVLVVEDDKMQREAVRDLLGNGDLFVDEAPTAKAALEALAKTDYDCVILDLRLPDMSGFDLLERMNARQDAKRVPVVVYTGKDLDRDEQERLEQYAESIVIKGVRSPERLLDEVTLFLHRVEERLPPDSQALLKRLRLDDSGLKGSKIMLVDDDMRNVYALVAALDNSGVRTVVARNGQEALDKLAAGETPDLVLMDIMMPVMDGYETMRQIRKDQRLRRLPIIALTAKAMRGDIKMCLDAGANDYLAKPVQLDQLLSLIRVWLPRRV
jgi:CheY-like chemotaxis protein/signal transduction histidine kinase